MFLQLSQRLLCLLLLSLSASSLPTSSPNIVRFEIDLTFEKVNYVGLEKSTFLMNGQSPGPTLHVAVGDQVEFIVHNYTPFGTTIHFHGIEQKGTPWSDGVPGMSQRLIEEGTTFIYEWVANESGQYFYHGHHRGHVADGLFGSIIVDPAPGTDNPFSMISDQAKDIVAMQDAELCAVPVIVSDWFQITFDELLGIEKASGFDITCPDAITINGKGSIQCPGTTFLNSLASPPVMTLLNGSSLTPKGCLPLQTLAPELFASFTFNESALPSFVFVDCNPTEGQGEVITVDPGAGWASINFVSTSSVSTLEVSIDSHPMYIYAVDGRYIEPQLVNAVTVPNGNRYQAMVKLDQTPGNYTIRVATVGLNQISSGFATLSYLGGNSNHVTGVPFINYAGANTSANFVPFSDNDTVPLETISLSPDADQMVVVNISNFHADYIWTLSGDEAFSSLLEDVTPLLFSPQDAEAMNRNLSIVTGIGQWVDIVLQVLPPIQPSHAIHKHSNKAFILGQGTGAWNYTSVAEAAEALPLNFNFHNPVKRDMFTTPPALTEPSWMVIRYYVENPGVFALHCHIQTHLSGGMVMAIIDAPENFPPIPEQYLTGRFPDV